MENLDWLVGENVPQAMETWVLERSGVDPAGAQNGMFLLPFSTTMEKRVTTIPAGGCDGNTKAAEAR